MRQSCATIIIITINQGYFLPVWLLDNEIYTTRGNSGLYLGLKMKNGSYSVKFNLVRAANGSRRFAKHISRSNTNFDKGCEQNGPKVTSFQYSLTSAAQGCLTWGDLSVSWKHLIFVQDTRGRRPNKQTDDLIDNIKDFTVFLGHTVLINASAS